MNYFAKLLPVEGEIKEGDSYIISGKSYSKSFVPFSQPASELMKKRHPEITNYGEWLNKVAQKAKLFLCSRDIQIGDKVTHDSLKEEDICEDIVEDAMHLKGDTEGHYTSMNQWFKVIGEISPEAIWVTDGMELDTEGLHFPDWVSEDVKVPWVKIKCPTCKQFH